MSLPRTSIGSTLEYRTSNQSMSSSHLQNQSNRYYNKVEFHIKMLSYPAVFTLGNSTPHWHWFPWRQQAILFLAHSSASKEGCDENAGEWRQSVKILGLHGTCTKAAYLLSDHCNLIIGRTPLAQKIREGGSSSTTNSVMIRSTFSRLRLGTSNNSTVLSVLSHFYLDTIGTQEYWEGSSLSPPKWPNLVVTWIIQYSTPLGTFWSEQQLKSSNTSFKSLMQMNMFWSTWKQGQTSSHPKPSKLSVRSEGRIRHRHIQAEDIFLHVLYIVL